MKGIVAFLFLLGVAFGAEIFNPKEAGGAPLMLSEGTKCSVLPNGTEVEILETKTMEKMPSIKIVKVRVLSGPCKGDEGWVLDIHVRKSTW